ncbi:MAG: hypothetical protein WA673_04175 [Candidatus Acidiferrales bacterium]
MSKKLKAGILIVILIVLAVSFLRLFVDRPAGRTYQETVALNAQDPTPSGVPSPEDSSNTVSVYRTGRAGAICYDTFHSQELRKALSSKNGQRVSVEFDTFNDFGKVRDYNVHSIDGIVMANGDHLLRPEYAGISGIESTGEGAASGGSCW